MKIIYKEKPGVIELWDGTRIWKCNGKIHRDNGPAIERPDGKNGLWFFNGKEIHVPKHIKNKEKYFRDAVDIVKAEEVVNS
jgi:hypothetical protein